MPPVGLGYGFPFCHRESKYGEEDSYQEGEVKKSSRVELEETGIALLLLVRPWACHLLL